MFLRKLTIQNFKGIKSFSIDFTNKETFIYGDNGTGKSSLFDAYTWLLFGKDSQGQSDSGTGKFEIRPLNANNEPEHYLEHKVEAIFEHDGKTHKIGRLLTEKWVKDQESKEVVLKSMETTRFWSDAPIKEKDFTLRLAELFTDSDIFKLLSDPLAFSKLHWTKRKQIISDLCGITEKDSDILDNTAKTEFLFLKSHLTTIQFKDLVSKIKFERAETQKKLDEIPVRINQEKKSMPEMPDVEALTKRRDELKGLLTSIDTEHDKFINAQREAIKARQTKLNSLLDQMEKMIQDEAAVIRKKYVDDARGYEAAKSELSRIRAEHDRLLNDIKVLQDAIDTGNKRIESLRDDFRIIQKEVMPVNSTICPTCSQEYPENKLAEIRANFGTNQKARLDRVNEQGKHLSVNLTNHTNALSAKKEELNICAEILKEKEEEYKSIPIPNPVPSDIYEIAENNLLATNEFQAVKKEYHELNDSALQFEEYMVDADVKNSYLNELLIINDQLSVKNDIDSRTKSIEILTKQQEELAEQLLEGNRLQEEVNDYVRFKTALINEQVQKIFKTVRFKFFEYHMNGGFNDQMCEIMCNGVDWVNMNSALKVNAGMEIIKAMQETYRVVLPIWIDNRESIIDLFENNAQVINLCVSRDKELTIKDF